MSLRASSSSPRWHRFPGVRLFLLQQTRMQYRYLPLGSDEIRLIKLRPTCEGAELSVSFAYTIIKEAAGTYETLSYTWGNTTEQHVLLCDDDSYLTITPSLKSALLDLRLNSAPRVLWVDAICICQGDLLERGRQVVLMEQIYRNAEKTVVYLGEKSANSELAAEYLENHMWRVRGAIADFINQRRFADDSGEMMQICIKTLGTSQAKLFEGFDQHAVQKALMDLLSRPWFRRIWVIQEFVVSPAVNMYCGKTICEWGSFGMMFYYSLMEAKVSWDHIVSAKQKINFFRGLTQMMQMHELRNQVHDKDDDNRKLKRLNWLLSRCRTAEATMSVDKIFALLNLSSSPRILQPNYMKSKADIYREFAEISFEDGSGGAVLSEAALTNQADPSLPSWVPNWSEAPVRINLSQTLIASQGMFFDADGSRDADEPRPKLCHRIEGNILFVKGVIVQSIHLVGPDRPVPGGIADEAPNLANLVTILSYIQMFLAMETTYPRAYR